MTGLVIDLAAAQLVRDTATAGGPVAPVPSPRRPLFAAIRHPIRRPLTSLAL